MSLLKRISNIFKSNDQLVETLTQLLKPSSQKQFEQASATFSALLLNNTDDIFNMLRNKDQVQQFQPKPENLLNLLLIFHKHITNEDIAEQMRMQPIYWVARLMDENKESFRVIERMMTEPSTSSFFPQPQPTINQQPTKSRITQVQDKRKDRLELNQQLQNPSLNPSLVPDVQVINTQQIKPKIFCILYYSYLQKQCVNIPIIQAVRQFRYPYEQPDDVKLRSVWWYKIQNAMQLGLKLLENNNTKVKLYQNQVYEDLMYYQRFLGLEIDYQFDKYATMSSIDTLSLYEIYQEYQRSNTVLRNFDASHNIKFQTPPKIIDEFLGFSIKLKVLNQFQFKKSLNVPTSKHPLGDIKSRSGDKQRATSYIEKENNEPLNMNDLESDLHYEREVVVKKFYNQSTEQSIEDEPAQRHMHVKGLSTFHY